MWVDQNGIKKEDAVTGLDMQVWESKKEEIAFQVLYTAAAVGVTLRCLY